MFLFGSSLQTGFSYLGFFSGIILACLIGYFIVVQGRRINLRPFFSVTSLFLVLFAAGMVAYGTHEMEEFVVKGGHLEFFGMESKNEITRPWNVLVPQAELESGASELFYNFNEKKGKYIHILHDKGSIGSFLKGFFGYNSNPNWIELFVWLFTLGFGLSIWRRFYKSVSEIVFSYAQINFTSRIIPSDRDLSTGQANAAFSRIFLVFSSTEIGILITMINWAILRGPLPIIFSTSAVCTKILIFISSALIPIIVKHA